LERRVRSHEDALAATRLARLEPDHGVDVRELGVPRLRVDTNPALQAGESQRPLAAFAREDKLHAARAEAARAIEQQDCRTSAHCEKVSLSRRATQGVILSAAGDLLLPA